MLNGGAGNDILQGGAGDDTYIVDAVMDHVYEGALSGIDTVRTSASSYFLSDHLENLVWTGTGNFFGSGNAGYNSITGGAGIDHLTENGGNDTIRGGGGADAISGDSDVPPIPASKLPGISMGSGQVTKAANINIGSIQTALNVSNTFSLAADPEIGDATVVPHVSINATGGGHIDYYAVNISQSGASIVADIDHGFGNDGQISYQSRIDLYDSAGNGIARTYGGGDTDAGAGGSTGYLDAFLSWTVNSPGTYYIAVSKFSWSGNQQPEAIPQGATYELQVSVVGELTSYNDSLYGDGGNDTLTGNQGDDKLYGGTDNDRLDGGDGVDTMEGGTGNDTYVVDNARDVVTELGSQGIDTVESFITTTLGANVENLALQGNANINGFGNAGANVISDNAGNNMLVGGLGADIIRLGAGKDSVLFNSALGNGNIDRIEGFNVADDHIKLEDAVFRAVGPANSWLAADAFWTGPSAHDASDRIIYDRVSGALYYDADGTGSAAQVQFATLAPGLDLTSRDFWIG